MLVTFLPAQMIDAPPLAPVSLYGIWKDKFPADLELDAILSSIRGEWLEDIVDVSDE
ncbi:MAG: hypothetical protein M3Y56_05395 [Armatimonadota bacterium]|nr:hypothetical protein [Armatimonadota bacterium]